MKHNDFVLCNSTDNIIFDLCGSNLLIKVIANLLFAQTTYIYI